MTCKYPAPQVIGTLPWVVNPPGIATASPAPAPSLQVTVILLVKMWTEENHIVQYFPRCWGVKIISVPQKQYDSCYVESSILILR